MHFDLFAHVVNFPNQLLVFHLLNRSTFIVRLFFLVNFICVVFTAILSL